MYFIKLVKQVGPGLPCSITRTAHISVFLSVKAPFPLISTNSLHFQENDMLQDCFSSFERREREREKERERERERETVSNK